LVYELKVADPQ
jgi:hypothetical protein